MEVAGGGAAVVGGASSPRRVVVAVDESEESMHALSWCLSNVVSAAKAAAAPPPAVVLVHARSPRPFYCPSIDGAGYILTQQVMDSMDQYTASAADTIVTKAKSICTAFPNLRVETCVEKGDPRDVICGAAEKAGADLLVMGSHGYGFLQRALVMGSRRFSLELELEFQFDMGNLGKEGVENCCRGMDQGFSANSQLAYGEC